MENNNEKVILLDENGDENTFVHVLTFKYEGEKYVALAPNAEADSEEEEIVILRIADDGGEDIYVSVDNKVLLEEVFDEFLTLMEEINEESGGDEQ